MARLRNALPWLACAAAVLAADQATKAWASAELAHGWREVTSFFNLVLMHNTGSAFSFLADAGGWQQFFFGAVAIAVSGAMVWMMLQETGSALTKAAASLVLGGAVGNLIDRLAWGAVTDFLDFHWGTLHWPAFNVADAAIVAGVALLMLSELRGGERSGR